MGSLDVVSLLNNVPLDETISIVTNELFKDSNKISGMNKQDLTSLLNLAVNDTVFMFNGKYYTQVDGVAIGSPLGPS